MGKLNNNRKRKKCARYVIHESRLVILRSQIISYNKYVPIVSEVVKVCVRVFVYL